MPVEMDKSFIFISLHNNSEIHKLLPPGTCESKHNATKTHQPTLVPCPPTGFSFFFFFLFLPSRGVPPTRLQKRRDLAFMLG